MPVSAKQSTDFKPVDTLTFMMLFTIRGAVNFTKFDSIDNLEIAKNTSFQTVYDRYCESEKSELVNYEGHELRHTFYNAEYEGRMMMHIACFNIHEDGIDVQIMLA
jgi:hypothetical protein